MIAVATGLTQEAAILTPTPEVVIFTGVAARDRLDSLVPNECTGLVSWGTAGSLVNEVPVGAVMLLHTVVTATDAFQTDDAWTARLHAAFPESGVGDGYSGSTERARTATDKLALGREYHVETVDQTAFAVADMARKRKIPFVAIQGISDAFDQTIPRCAIDCVRPDGSQDVSALMAKLARRPQDIWSLMVCGQTFHRAIRSLTLCYGAIGSSVL